MTRAVVRLDCPPVTAWGDQVPVTVTVEGSGAAAIRDARLILGQRSTSYGLHFNAAVLSRSWKATTEQSLIATTSLHLQDGPAGGASCRATVTTPTDVLVPTSTGAGHATVTTVIEAEVAFQDGSVERAQCQLLVWGGSRYVPGFAAQPPVPDRLELELPGDRGVARGTFRHPLAGTAILRAGASSVPEGRLELVLVRRVVIKDPEVPKRFGSEDSFSLGHVPTPAIKRGSGTAVPFSWVAPGGLAQTAEAPAFSVTWTAEAAWRVGDETVTFAVPVVMSAAVGSEDAELSETQDEEAPLAGRMLYRMLHGKAASPE